MQIKHIVLIGLNFYLKRHMGDKNFWIQLLPILATQLKKVTILSVRNNPFPEIRNIIGSCDIEIKYLSPKILGIGENKKNTLIKRKGSFPAFWGVIEKLLSVKMICAELKRIYKKEPYDYVHLMDNMGIANRIIASRALTDVSVSAMAYQGKNKFIYNNYLLLSYRHPKILVVPYSKTYAQKLFSIGVPHTHIKHIPWGVKLHNYERSEEENRDVRLRLSIPSDKKLFLWSGFIQQIQRKDFLFAYKCAKKALSKGLQGIFIFAFKSPRVAKEFKHLDSPEYGICIKATSVEEFNSFKKAADVFYSPVFNKNVILAPPLTWIEMLSEGVPIITTNVGGADEIVENGKTGFIARNEEEVTEKLFEISQCYKEMQENCYEKTQTQYDIEKIAEKYLHLWSTGGQNGV